MPAIKRQATTKINPSRLHGASPGVRPLSSDRLVRHLLSSVRVSPAVGPSGSAGHHVGDPVGVGLHASVEAGDLAAADDASQADHAHQLEMPVDLLR